MCIYVSIYDSYAITINEKRGHEFKREQGYIESFGGRKGKEEML